MAIRFFHLHCLAQVGGFHANLLKEAYPGCCHLLGNWQEFRKEPSFPFDCTTQRHLDGFSGILKVGSNWLRPVGSSGTHWIQKICFHYASIAIRSNSIMQFNWFHGNRTYRRKIRISGCNVWKYLSYVISLLCTSIAIRSQMHLLSCECCKLEEHTEVIDACKWSFLGIVWLMWITPLHASFAICCLVHLGVMLLVQIRQKPHLFPPTGYPYLKYLILQKSTFIMLWLQYASLFVWLHEIRSHI